jgi:Putative zinc-finger
MLMRCRTARQWITRDLAGELPPRRVERLGRHVERCEGCRREQVAYAALDRALGLLPVAAEMPPRLEQDTLRRVRLAADDADPRPARGVGRWVLIGAPAVAAAAALGLVLHDGLPPDAARPAAVKPAGVAAAKKPAPPTQVAQNESQRPAAPQPAARKRRTLPDDPPAELAARPDLFVNLPMLRNLDKLQHFDAIQTTTLDGHEGDQSNG